MKPVLKCVSGVTCVILDLKREACCFLHTRHRPTMSSLAFYFHVKTTGEECP